MTPTFTFRSSWLLFLTAGRTSQPTLCHTSALWMTGQRATHGGLLNYSEIHSVPPQQVVFSGRDEFRSSTFSAELQLSIVWTSLPSALGTGRVSASGTELTSHYHNPPRDSISSLPGTSAEVLIQETMACLIPLMAVAQGHPTFRSGWCLHRIFELSVLLTDRRA